MKNLLKMIVMSVFYVLVFPFGFPSRAIYKLTGKYHLFAFFSELFSILPGIPGVLVRCCFYKQTLDQAYFDLRIGFGTVVTKMETRIGRRVITGGHAIISLSNIGDNAAIGSYVSILSGRYQHNFDKPDTNIMSESRFTVIQIGSNTFIGEKSLIMADIGSNTVIGAGSVVTKPVPDYVVAVGNPARIAKERPRPAAS